MRTVLKNESFVAFKKALEINDFNAFTRHMNPLVKRYRWIESPFMVRVKRKLKRIFARFA